MKPEQLLEYYDRFADAPDAIPRLRRFILDLAVRGKLVEQDPSDEPESELMKQSAGRGVEPKTALPSNWLVVPIEQALDFKYGKGLKADERLKEGPVPVFGSNGVVGYTTEPLAEEPAIIVGRKG